jgi:hypothetical protein
MDPVAEPDDLEVSTPDNRKKIILISAVVVFAFLISLAGVLVSRNMTKRDEQKFDTNGTQGSKQTTQNAPSGSTNNSLPLIKKDDVSKTNENVKKPAVNYDFKYKIDPKLLKKSSMIPTFLKAVFAQETDCAPTNVPASLPVYVFKKDYTATEAASMAEKYGIKAKVYSQKTDGGADEYYVADPEVNGNALYMFKPSGKYRYHYAIKDFGAEIDEATAENLANSALTKIGITEKIVKTSNITSPQDDANRFTFFYRHFFADTSVIDSTSVNSLGDKTPCMVSPATTMSSVEIRLAKDGTVTNILANVRKTLKKEVRKTLDLPGALAAGGFKSLIDPIVLSDKLVSSGSITIDQASSPLYLDLGPSYAQACTIPVYLTSGKLPDGTRVLSIFPAVSMDGLAELCGTKDALQTNGTDKNNPFQRGNTLQYSSFSAKEPTPTSPPLPPVGAQCFGNQVDYSIMCNGSSQNAGSSAIQTNCSIFMGIPVDKAPDRNVCDTGCKLNNNITFTSSSMSSVCEEFLKEFNKSRPASKAIPVPTTIPGSPASGSYNQELPAGSYSCSVSICPC